MANVGNPFGNPNMVPGNRLSAAENISEEANRRRIKGALRSAANKQRIAEGAKIVLYETPKIRKRLKQVVAAEAREVQERARSLAMEAMDELGRMMVDDKTNGAVKVAAIQAIFDRAYGKPGQTTTNLNVDANGTTDVTQTELVQRIAETLRRVEAITGGAVEKTAGEERPADLRKRYRNPDSSSFH